MPTKKELIVEAQQILEAIFDKTTDRSYIDRIQKIDDLGILHDIMSCLRRETMISVSYFNSPLVKEIVNNILPKMMCEKHPEIIAKRSPREYQKLTGKDPASVKEKNDYTVDDYSACLIFANGMNIIFLATVMRTQLEVARLTIAQNYLHQVAANLKQLPKYASEPTTGAQLDDLTKAAQELVALIEDEKLNYNPLSLDNERYEYGQRDNYQPRYSYEPGTAIEKIQQAVTKVAKLAIAQQKQTADTQSSVARLFSNVAHGSIPTELTALDPHHAPEYVWDYVEDDANDDSEYIDLLEQAKKLTSTHTTTSSHRPAFR